MSDARRSDIISGLDPRAWERLADPSSQTPSSAVVAAAVEERVHVGPESRRDSGNFNALTGTTVPTVDDLDRVHSKLVLLRDALLRKPQAEDTQSVFDGFDAKNSSRSSRWDAWQTMPPYVHHDRGWAVCVA